MTTEHEVVHTGTMARHARPRRSPLVTGLIALLLLVGVVLAIKYTRHHIFAKQFAEVEPGRIYRSGELQRWPLERVIDEYKIKTILTLLSDEPHDGGQQAEAEVAEANGVEIIRIGMPGDGCAPYEDILRAAQVLGDPSKQPVLVHCAAGVHRTGATVATYRMLYEGWDFDRAMAEQVDHGYRADAEPKLMNHMRAFYEQELKARIESDAGPPAAITPATRTTDSDPHRGNEPPSPDRPGLDQS